MVRAVAPGHAAVGSVHDGIAFEGGSGILLDLIWVCGHSNQCRQAGRGEGDFVCRRVSARFLHGFCTVSKRAEGAFRYKIRQRVQKLLGEKSRCLD